MKRGLEAQMRYKVRALERMEEQSETRILLLLLGKPGKGGELIQ